MGRLKDHLKRYKNESMRYTELAYLSNLIIHQVGDEILIGKDRYHGSYKDFVTPIEAISLILDHAIQSDMTETLTPSAMFNEAIKHDLKEAFNDVLKKHGLKAKLSN